MMQNRHDGILRSINGNKKYNILTFPTHERYQSNLSKLPHTFYLFQGQGIKPWLEKYAPMPENHVLLDGTESQIKPQMRFDIVLSQNKFGQFQKAYQLANQMNLPLVNIEHTLPVPTWGPKRKELLGNTRSDVNIFISEYSAKQWGYDLNDKDVEVIHHAIDTDLFKPSNEDKDFTILTVANDYINRDIFLGWSIYDKIRSYEYSKLKFNPVGDTPGLSRAATNVYELAKEYQKAYVFLNTSTVSPIPTSLLEAMSSSLPCVSTDTCMIPEIIKDGYNGYLYKPDQPNIAYDRLEFLSENPDKAKELGENARKTILEKFNLTNHLEKWNNIFNKVVGRGFNFK